VAKARSEPSGLQASVPGEYNSSGNQNIHGKLHFAKTSCERPKTITVAFGLPSNPMLPGTVVPPGTTSTT